MRDLARRNERSSWAPIAPDAGGYVSRFGTLAGVDGVRSPRRVELVPYSLARRTRAPLDRANPFYERTALGGALGADLGLGITSKLTLTATINPDFGQVEADPSEVNLTGVRDVPPRATAVLRRGRRHLPVHARRRTRSAKSSCSTRGASAGRRRSMIRTSAFAVDRPGRDEILGAAKLSGKIGSWTLGVLDAVTGAERAPARGSQRTARVVHRGTEDELRGRPAVARRRGRTKRASVWSRRRASRPRSRTPRHTLRSSALTAGVDGRIRIAEPRLHVRREPGRQLRARLAGGDRRDAAVVRSPAATSGSRRRPARHDANEPRRRVGRSPARRSRVVGTGDGASTAESVTSGFEVERPRLSAAKRCRVDSGLGRLHALRAGARGASLGHVDRTTGGDGRLDGERERLASNLFTNVQFQNNWMVMVEVRRELSQLSATLPARRTGDVRAA